MRSKSPELMKKINEYVEQFYLNNGVSPSIGKIAIALGIGKTTAYRYLIEMADKGLITYDGQTIETIVTNKINGNNNSVPILGAVSCGLPELEEENIEEYISLPTAIFGKGDFFILHADGESMIEAGIDNGDLVVVKKQNEANEGDIVVALVDNQSTLKRFYRDHKNHKIILHPENKTMNDIIVNECFIQGVACHVIKTL